MAKKKCVNLPKLLDGKFFKVLTDNWSSTPSNIDAQCQTCGKIRKGSIRSTGNFMDHYISCHPSLVKIVDQYRKQKEMDNPPLLRQTTLNKLFGPLTTQLVSLIYLHYLSLHVSNNNVVFYSYYRSC